MNATSDNEIESSIEVCSDGPTGHLQTQIEFCTPLFLLIKQEILPGLKGICYRYKRFRITCKWTSKNPQLLILMFADKELIEHSKTFKIRWKAILKWCKALANLVGKLAMGSIFGSPKMD